MDCPLDRLQLAIESKIEVFKKTWPWGSAEDEEKVAAPTKKWSIEDTGPYKGPPDATGLFMFLTAKAAEGAAPKDS